MRQIISIVTCLLLPYPVVAGDLPPPVTNPIQAPISKGDITVRAEKYVRAPRTQDLYRGTTHLRGTPRPLANSNAYARLQHMKPVPDHSQRFAVSDLRGVLYMSPAASPSLSPYIDLRRDAPDFASAIFPNEAGLLGFAFHPDFDHPGRPGYGKVYTAYSGEADSGTSIYLEDEQSTHESVIREWTATDPRANRFEGTTREVFRVGQFAQNHNIGNLAFDPTTQWGDPDHGLLFFSLGDGGGALDPQKHGQNPATPLAGLLRIDPTGRVGQHKGHQDYSIPPTNPYLGIQGAVPELWAMGLRHAQHFSFDPAGRLFINDIGQMHIEEVNLGVAGANYGWSAREGTFRPGFSVDGGYAAALYPPDDDSGFTDPIVQYDHDEGAAIGSGYAYQGSLTALHHQYVFADIVNGRVFYFDIRELDRNQKPEVKELRVRFDGAGLTALEAAGYADSYAPGQQRVDLRLGTDGDGELYVLTKGDGWIRKITAN